MTAFIKCQQPLTCATNPLLFRLGCNGIGPEGARHLALALEANSTLRVLGYVAKTLMTDAMNHCQQLLTPADNC